MALSIMEEFIMTNLHYARENIILDMVLEGDELRRCCTLVHKLFGKMIIMRVYWDVIENVVVVEYENEKGRFYEEGKDSTEITVRDVLGYMNIKEVGEHEMLDMKIKDIINERSLVVNVSLSIRYDNVRSIYLFDIEGESEVEYGVGY